MIDITHFITFDRGAGPVSLVSFRSGAAESMMRLSHHARFQAVAKVDPAEARKAVAADQHLGEASVKVAPELAERLASEALAFAAPLGCRSLALRWDSSGRGMHFATEEEARAWDRVQSEKDEHVGPGAPLPIVRTRRRVMMG